MLKKLFQLFISKEKPTKNTQQSSKIRPAERRKKIESTRIGELGEHKINIQLDQLPKGCNYLSDIMIKNSKSRSGYSQIDHIVITPYGLFVIETKNYNGEIKGTRENKFWTVSNRFRMYNPLMQNYGHIKALESILTIFHSLQFISLISFTMRCRFSIDPVLRKIESNELIVYDVELSEFINRKLLRLKTVSDQPLLTESDIASIYKIIQDANITDPSIRAEHVKNAK